MGKDVKVQIFKRILPIDTLSQDGSLVLWKYEWHMGKTCMSAGLETFEEIARDLIETFRGSGKRFGDIIVDFPPTPRRDSRNSEVMELNDAEITEFVKIGGDRFVYEPGTL